MRQGAGECISNSANPCIAALANGFAQASCGWHARTEAPDLATRLSTTEWYFTLSSDIPWLGVVFVEDGKTWRWAKASADTAAALQTVRLALTNYSRFEAHEVRVGLLLGGYSCGAASLAGTVCRPKPTSASQPVVMPHLKSGATVRFGMMVELASLHLAEGLRAWMVLVAEVDTESRWRGQWRVRPEIPGDFPPQLACLREWRLSGEGTGVGGCGS
jgi:hypothetical protein